MRCALALGVLAGLTFGVGCSGSESSEPSTGGGGTGGASGGSGGSGGVPAGGGGTAASGGTAPAGGGSAGQTGGAPGAGGSGGSAATGGSVATGGSSAMGGGPAAGGSSATGGAAGAAGAGACDPSLAATNKATVNAALDALFVDKQLSAIDQYWADPYLQHNPIAVSGVDAFRDIMGLVVPSASFSYERLRTFTECDLAVVQGRYSGTGVIFDMFRLSDGKLIEHWDSDANQASDAGGATEATNPEQTGASRAVALGFLTDLVADDLASALGRLATDYVEHREGFAEAISSDNVSYTTVHHVIADGNFVFTLSEGTLQGTPYGFYDLFRIDAGQIVEHWDSRRVVPATTESGLDIF